MNFLLSRSLFCFLIICLNLPNTNAVIVNEDDCLQKLTIEGKVDSFLVKEDRYLNKETQERCLTRVYCNNISSSATKRFDVSVLHACNEKGKEDDTKNSYYDFSNSLSELIKHPREGTLPQINSVFQQGFKVYVAGYGFDDLGKIWSRVSVSKEYISVDNRDRYSDRINILYQRKNGIFRFEKTDSETELYFYKPVSCGNKSSVKLKLLDGCFIKEKLTYPKYEH